VEGEDCWRAAFGVTRGVTILELEWETSDEVKRHGEVFEVRARVIYNEAIHFP